MKKRVVKSGRSVVGPNLEPDTAGLMNKMMQQLILLDRKMDALISRSSERPADPRRFSMPSQRFDQPQRQAEPRQDNNYRERAMHKAICADCNKECEVPFKPSGDRPVYCKECFAKRKNGSSFRDKSVARPAHAALVHAHHANKPSGETPKPVEKRKAISRKRPVKGRSKNG